MVFFAVLRAANVCREEGAHEQDRDGVGLAVDLVTDWTTRALT